VATKSILLTAIATLTLCVSVGVQAQAGEKDDEAELDGEEAAEDAQKKGAEGSATGSTAETATPPAVVIQTGAPTPPGQNLASPLPATPVPATAVVKVGGGMILLYSNNYAPSYDAQGNKKKHLFDVWRASIVLDSKLDRFGIHYEFRARDRSLRWMPVNSWIEELYASADLMAAGSTNPLTLKVGKIYNQFGRFWDNSFYGNIHLRDGLKLVPDWGLSAEGTVGAGSTWGLKYYAQYFVIDGNSSTSNNNRDTNAEVVAGTINTTINARQRDKLVLRIEPSWTLSPAMTVKVGASFTRFDADHADTKSAAAVAAMSRINDVDNSRSVTRWGVDFAAQLAWVGLWGEFVKQSGAHVNSFPYGPLADNPATPMVNEARNGSASNDVTYWLGGINFTYDRFTIQYNYNSASYANVLNPFAPETARFTHKEWIHNPSIQVKISDQLRLILEAPFWLRTAIPGLPSNNPEQLARPAGSTEVVEKQILATLHGRI
jgi:hypothetical protein